MKEELVWVTDELESINRVYESGSCSRKSQGALFAFEEVLCHNDLLSGNILKTLPSALDFQQEEKQIRLIDYEYSAYNYRAYDLSNHFCGECFAIVFIESFT